MAVFDIDLTTAGGPPDGVHLMTINKVEYQVKTGEKWNKEGTSTVTAEEAIAYPRENVRIHLTLAIAGAGNFWHDLYLGESSAGFRKQFCQAANIPLKNVNYDELVGKQILGTLTTSEREGYGARQQLSKVAKA